jgi:PTS system glucose-specific IIA component
MNLFQPIKQWIATLGSSSSELIIYAPLSGEIVKLETVPDKVFAEKLIGDGLAIKPTGDTLVAPINGTIGKIFETNHAFSIASNSGVELLVHFGIDTIELQGKGFQRLAQSGQSVKCGDPIISFDLPWLEKNAKSTLTPVVIANMDALKSLTKLSGQVILAETIIMRVEQ